LQVLAFVAEADSPAANWFAGEEHYWFLLPAGQKIQKLFDLGIYP
jgi:hypothetical protein